MARVLVSGGGGYVGRFIVDALVERGHQVVVGGRKPPPEGLFPPGLGYVPLHLDPERDQRAAFGGIDIFVHAAFDHLPGRYRGGEGNDPAGFRRRNGDGSAALFEQAREAGVSRAVFLSSRGVYGTQPPGAELTEEARPHPDTLYGEVKLAAERRLAALSDAAFAGTSLRVTGVYGAAAPGQAEDKWTPLIRGWIAGEPVEPRAGTEVHGNDVGAGVLAVLDAPHEAVGGKVFNVSDLMVDRSDILAIVQQATGLSHPLPPPADTSRINAMSTGALRRLGWKPGGAKRLRDTVLDLTHRLRN